MFSLVFEIGTPTAISMKSFRRVLSIGMAVGELVLKTSENVT